MSNPPPGYALAAVDDCATGNGSMMGWAMFVLNPVAGVEFASKVRELCRQTGIKSFHGRRFRSGNHKSYGAFLAMARDSLQRSCHGEAVFQLIESGCYRRNAEEAVKLAVGAMKLGGATSPAHVGDAFAQVFWLAKYAEINPGLMESAREFRIELARGPTPVLTATKLTAFGRAQEQAEWVQWTYNAFRKTQCGGKGPTLRGIKVVEACCSPMVQVADVFANFGMARLRKRLLPGSGGRKTSLKVEILRETFDPEDTLGTYDLGSLAGGGGEIRCELRYEINYRVRSYMPSGSTASGQRS